MTRSGIGDAPKRREDLRFLTGAGPLSRRSRVRRPGACGRAALAARACPDRAASIPAAARALPGVLAVLTADERQGRRAAAAAAVGRRQYRNRRAVRLRAAAAARRRQGPLCRRAGGADRRRDPGAGARRRRARSRSITRRCRRLRPQRPARRRAADRRRGAGQSLPRLADRRRGGGRCRVRRGGACRLPPPRQPPRRHQPDGAARRRRRSTTRRAAATRAHVSAQSIHATRDHAARALGVPPAQVRFVAPDVGGGFGAKNFIYPEHVLLPWAAKRVGRPVKWIATPQRGLPRRPPGARPPRRGVAGARRRGPVPRTAHRQHRQSRRLSGGQRRRGADVPVRASCPARCTASRRSTLSVAAVFTNTAPIGVLRGPGYGEMVNIIERLIDAAAAQTGFDRAELRRRNLVPAAAMPTDQRRSATASTAAPFPRRSSARSPPPMSPALPRGGATARRAGRLRGLGFAYHIKGTGGAPSENVDIRFEADGTVSLITGTQTIGQGHETTLPADPRRPARRAERADPSGARATPT